VSRRELTVPDLGNFDSVEVVDVLVKPGDTVEIDTPLITLETDKASMDVPSTAAGKIVEVPLKRGDKVSKGSVIARLEGEGTQSTAVQPMPPPPARSSARPESGGDTVRMPLPEFDEKEAAKAAAAKAPAPDAKPVPAAPPAQARAPAAAKAPAAAAPTNPAPPAAPAAAPRANPAPPAAPAAASPANPAPAAAPAAASTAATPAPANAASSAATAKPAPAAQPAAQAASPAQARAPAPASPPPAAGSASPGTASAPPTATSPGERKTQVLVIGAGPGGYTAAFRAADLGLHVTLVERWPMLGGVCLNVGCIPSKALLHAAKVIEEASEMGAHGIAFGDPAIDLDKLREWKMSVVRKLTGGLKLLSKQRKVEVVQGAARFAGPNVVEVSDGTGATARIRFDQCIIAVGSEPIRLPGLPKDPRIMDSTDALELPEFSGRLLVIGGGIIGLEMATVYDALGSKVSVVELTPQLMPGADVDLVRPLEKRLRARYEQILLSTKVTKVEPQADGLRVTFEGPKAPEPQVFGRVLVSVGRAPNGRLINAEAAGVTVNERGFIPVDRQLRTNVPHIFAIGDVVGQPMLAHKAMHEAKVAAEVAAGQKHSFDVRGIPSVAYTDPEIAWVGLTETEATAKGIAVRKGLFPWIASGRSLSIGRDEGFTKLLFDPASHRLLGAGIVGSNAGELIAELGLAIEMGADAGDIALTVHPHPTLSETVGLAAEAFEGTLTDLYIPKR
jgi:dihydrolipoamide dehydrogenase